METVLHLCWFDTACFQAVGFKRGTLTRLTGQQAVATGNVTYKSELFGCLCMSSRIDLRSQHTTCEHDACLQHALTTCVVRYRDGMVPQQRQFLYQICDLQDEALQALASSKPLRTTCHVSRVCMEAIEKWCCCLTSPMLFSPWTAGINQSC